MPLNILVLKRH